MTNTRSPRSLRLLFATLLLAAPLVSTAAGPAAVTVELKDVAIGIAAEATVEAVRQATVGAQVPGRVLEMRVEAGQRVAAGQVLARIDVREAAGSEAAAQASLAQAKASYERTRNLHGQKFVSQAALDQAEAAWKAAQAGAGAAGASVSHGTISAPFAGIVAQRHVEAGDMATPGLPLMTIYEPRGLRVVASVPQNRLADVRKAASARIDFPELGQSVTATRIEILPAVDARSHTGTARLYLPDGLPGIVPGMAARAHFVAGQAKKLTVPAAAVLRRGEITGVYVLDAKNQPRLRQVRLGEAVANGDLEVLAGIDAGERVSLEPVKAGIQVRNVAK